MAVLKISEQHGADGQHVTELAKNCQRPLTLSELFIMGPGRKARSLLTSDTRDQVTCLLFRLFIISGTARGRGRLKRKNLRGAKNLNNALKCL